MGKLLVLEGLDGSGKATQAKLLAQALAQRGLPVRQVSFPNYESPSSALVKMYLNGAFGEKPDAVNPYAASTFYAVDRYASYQTLWKSFYEDGGLVLADRYTTSNAIHQCAKLPRAQWEHYLAWLFQFEYEQIAIPKPDMVIYLNVEPSVSQRLLARRYGGDDTRKDIHEKDAGYLCRSHEAADYCAQTLGWHTVVCVREQEMRSVQDIHAEVLATVLRGIGTEE